MDFRKFPVKVMHMRDYPFVFPVKETVYKEIGGRKLRFFVFEPDAAVANRTAVLFFNGSTFMQSPVTPADFQYHAHYLASKGYVAICVECRTAYDAGFTPLQAIRDARSAVRRLRGRASEWGVDPNRVVVCASSSGGYTVVSAIMFDHLNDEGDDLSVSPVPDALVIFAAGMDGVNIMERLYPELLTEAQSISPYHNVKKCLPPTLWIIGTADPLYEQNRDFVERMTAAGNDIAWVEYEGMEHGFFRHGRHGNRPLEETRERIAEFLKSKGF
jgi:acetyl esterase/lipase